MNELGVYNLLPPCMEYSGKKSICGNTLLHSDCERCGFNPEENERRKQIAFTVRPDMTKRKIIKRGGNTNAAIT